MQKGWEKEQRLETELSEVHNKKIDNKTGNC